MSKEILADFHIHTKGGFDSKVPARDVIRKASELGIEVIALTDHDRVTHSSQLVEQAQEFSILLLPGCEVTTYSKPDSSLSLHFPHVLLVNTPPDELREFLKKHTFPLHMPTLKETLEWAHIYPEILVIAPHPHPKGTINSLNFEELREYGEFFHAIEGLNGAGELKLSGKVKSRKVLENYRQRARLAKEIELTIVGNSDAHTKSRVGCEHNRVFDNPRTASEIVAAIKDGSCKPQRYHQIERQTAVIYSRPQTAV
ncbi:MAG: PHP domain-containing protein [Patescibacteria group bacterium]